MILNDGKHVQGIFIYNPDIEYELGDFIVEEDCIYICKSGSPIKGKKPSKYPSLFNPYPGNMITSLDEYKEYLVSPNGKEDKYISSNILSGVLQDMYFGFGDSGLIGSYIKLKDKKYNIDTQLLSLIGKGTSAISKPLDLLMKEPTVNNAYVQVSRELLGVKNLLVNTGTDNCLLRQYTYQDLNDLGTNDSKGIYTEYRYRVQEMIDFENKISYFRSTRGSKRSGASTWQYNSTITPWSCTTVSKALLDKVNQIINYYANERDIEESTSTGFNFMNLVLHEGTSTKCTLISKDDDSPGSYSSVYPSVAPISSFALEPLILTMNIKVKMDNSTNVYKSYTCTFNTKDTASKSDSIDYYYLEKDVLLCVKYETFAATGRKVVTLDLVRSNQQTPLTNSEATILSIYYRSNGD